MTENETDRQTAYVELANRINANLEAAKKADEDPVAREIFVRHLEALKQYHGGGWGEIYTRAVPILDDLLKTYERQADANSTGNAHISYLRTNKTGRYTRPYLILLAHDIPAFAKAVFKAHKMEFVEPPIILGFKGKVDWSFRPQNAFWEMLLSSNLSKRLKSAAPLLAATSLVTIAILEIAAGFYIFHLYNKLDLGYRNSIASCTLTTIPAPVEPGLPETRYGAGLLRAFEQDLESALNGWYYTPEEARELYNILLNYTPIERDIVRSNSELLRSLVFSDGDPLWRARLNQDICQATITHLRQ
ncbi:MAG: hypothetical protein GYB36_12875 [Alphaproteobacteria bacterium]|nr:hypothetical protein [Alphaproteobacteria bacterium]